MTKIIATAVVVALFCMGGIHAAHVAKHSFEQAIATQAAKAKP